MLRGHNEENAVGSKKNSSRCNPVARTALLQTTRHNCQAKAPGRKPSVGKTFSQSRAQSSTSAPEKRSSNNTESDRSPRLLDPLKEASYRHVEVPCAERNIGICASARIKLLEEEGYAKTSEIQELKERLRNAKLQMAEVVAQSAILVRDVQYAARREVADALHEVHLLRNLEVRESQVNASVIGPAHAEATAIETDLAQTKKDLLDCRFSLSQMKIQLQWMSAEKEKLELNLRSSLQSALKLQNMIFQQKTLMKLEQRAIQERVRKEAGLLVQSARVESELILKQLHHALLSKGEAENLLKACVQLLCHAQKELSTMKILVEQQTEHFELLMQEKLQQLALAEEQVELQKEHFDELQLGTYVKCVVLECILEGVLMSLSTRASFERSDEKDDVRSVFSVEKVCKGGCIVTSSERFGFLEKEAILRENLIKSEYELEILGDKVDEQRAILEKVASLLDYISSFAVTSHNTKALISSIIEQLQKLEGDHPRMRLTAIQ